MLTEKYGVQDWKSAAFDEKIKSRTIEARKFKLPVSNFSQKTQETDLQVDGIKED